MDYFKKFLLSVFLISSLAHASIEQAPPSFNVVGKRAIWTDFTHAKYELSFDIKTRKAKSVAIIELNIFEKGYPIFDVVGTPTKVLVNGVSYSQQEIETPGKESKVRIIDHEFKAGRYKIQIESEVSNGVKFDASSVSAGFFMKDMRDREFLEMYIPSNYEYDQYKMEVSVRVTGSKKSHRLFTNGFLVEKSKNYFKYTYPDYFTSTSLYFHLAPEKKFKVLESVYETRLANGKDFPVTIYSRTKRLNRRIIKVVRKVLIELERDYGPWPHPHLIFYGDGKWKGGMEYAGAATAGWFAIGHELQHGYFARAVMPANGNAGWIDEAVASWRDFTVLHKIFPFRKDEINYTSMNLGNQSVFNRKTDHRSYVSGRSFMFYIDSLLKKVPGKSLKKFLKIYFENRKYTTIQSEDFRLDLEKYYGRSLKNLFDQYIYGRDIKNNSKLDGIHEKPFHEPLSHEVLQELI